MKVVAPFLRPGEIESFLRLRGRWECVIDIPSPPGPPGNIGTFEPIKPPKDLIDQVMAVAASTRADVLNKPK